MRLLRKKTSKAGRNNRGVITIRHRGGGHKQRYRIIDFLEEELAYVTQAIEGPHEGKYRDSFRNNIETPTFDSPGYVPKSPDYPLNTPPINAPFMIKPALLELSDS